MPLTTSRTTTRSPIPVSVARASTHSLLAAPTSATLPPGHTMAALLTESDTTITAFKVAGTTGLEVVDGTTLQWRQGGITLANGDVISAGFYGLEDRTTTADFQLIAITGTGGKTVRPSMSDRFAWRLC